MGDDGRLVPFDEMLDLLAWYRLSAVDKHDQFLFCRHGEHRDAPCEKCGNEADEEVTDMTPDPETPVPEPEPDEPTIG